MTHIDLPIALVNLQNGLGDGADLHLLESIMAPCAETSPAIIVVNEARWHTPRYRSARDAVHRLSALCARRYEIEIGEIDRSDHPPAVLWDTDQLRLLTWSDKRTDRHCWSRNSAELAVTETLNLRVLTAHFDYASTSRRLMEAQTLAVQVNPEVPTLVAGDLNATASGPHLPTRDWTREAEAKRHEKGRQLSDGSFVTATESVDTLIGVWDETSASRVGGAGLRALAELDWHQRGRPAHGLAATTYNSQPLLIDWLLANKHIDLVPTSYQVWDGDPAKTDHKLLTASIRMQAPR